MANFQQGGLAQSFMQANDNIAGAGIYLMADVSSSDTVTISLWDNLPNQAGAKLLAGGTGIGTQDSWFDVYWTPIAVVPSTTLYLVFSGNSTLGIGGDEYNPYASGMVFAGTGYEAFAEFDYTFRTFAASAVPEPSTCIAGLSALGMLGLFGLRNRRQGSARES